MATTTRKRKILELLKPLVDVGVLPLTVGASVHMRALRRIGMEQMPLTIGTFKGIGVYPLQDHYYEPLFDERHLRRALDSPRPLPAVDLNLERQLSWLERLATVSELQGIPERGQQGELHRENGTFEIGDIDALYAMMRELKPKRYIEVGSGNSTLVALAAAARNEEEGSPCQVTCIEPYEMKWLEGTEARVIRERVEMLDLSFIDEMEAGDILFIDSSHMIRPQGDVLFIYQELLPALPPGVFVHVHDIFTPRDYPPGWLIKKRLFWNEQYLLEAFLAFNDSFEVVLACNQLYHEARERLLEKFTLLADAPDRHQPKSFWMRRVK